MNLGPVMMDLQGTALSAVERDFLVMPQIGGLILFARNFTSKTQLIELIKAVRSLRADILIAVDQEGGRVQRFKDGFFRLSALGEVGKVYRHDPAQGMVLAKQHAQIMASELLAVGIDFSFAPVLDIDHGLNTVVGDRSFGQEAETVIRLAKIYIDAMHAAGMKACGKHFPGHGSVSLDSHVAMPKDPRPLFEIEKTDLKPFQALASDVDAMMPAHVIYSAVDSLPAGFSKIWLKDWLRQRLNFQGAIFSDDLSMKGASIVGDHVARAKAALLAGCDMVLVCNDHQALKEVLSGLTDYQATPEAIKRLENMRATTSQVSQ